jgi:glutaminyl-tRNA synthetase
MSEKPSDKDTRRSDFIRDLVRADVAAGKWGGKVCTRFPPEPNGYLHIGHAKSICLNFGLAGELGGVCHLRMDDTNPTTEDQEYVEAIQRDVRWLGFDWHDKMFYASDYFGRLYEIGERLIGSGHAFVCDCTEEEMGGYRGTVTQPGVNCPHRARSAGESLDLFRRMRAGEYAEGTKTLRGRIDMASPNMKLRDPPLYRIKRSHHYRTADAWCIYPLYDYAHCLSDSFEGITHSLCTTEFESARELYDWVVAAAAMPWVPRQTEFARLNISYMVMSKRKLLELVQGKDVNGWDDPRLPTIAGLRRRGCTPEAIREFCARIGVSKNLSTVDIALFEHTLREDLDARSPRVMGVLRPLKVVVETFPAGKVDELDAPFWPSGREGSRKLPFTRELYIEQDDFAEDPPKDFYRLAPGRTVRLRHAFIVTCVGAITDRNGKVVEVRVAHDPQTRGGDAAEGQKVDGTLHWVSAEHSIPAEVRLFDRLFSKESPGEDGDFRKDLNPNSLEILQARVEPSLQHAAHGARFQLERQGYFVVDPDSTANGLVLGRTVTLKDSWARAAAKPAPRAKAAKQTSAPAIAQELTASASALQTRLGLSADEARTLDAEPPLRALLEEAISAGAPAREAAALICNDLRGELRARKLPQAPFGGAQIAELVELLRAGTLSSRLAKEVLGEMLAGKGSPAQIIERGGLTVISDSSALHAVAIRMIDGNPALAARFRAGNANVMGALLGLAMRESGGRADPKALREALEAALMLKQ